MDMNGNNKCFNCGQYIDWQVIEPDNANAPFYRVVRLDKPKAEAIAIDKNKYEIIVTCPYCKTKNKFIKEL